MKSYQELEQLPPEAYLNPENFVSLYDKVETGRQRYLKGLEIGKGASTIHLSCRGVWGATMKDGSLLSSYEGIGYHSNTAELLRGFIDSGAPILVYRLVDGKINQTRIK